MLFGMIEESSPALSSIKIFNILGEDGYEEPDYQVARLTGAHTETVTLAQKLPKCRDIGDMGNHRIAVGVEPLELLPTAGPGDTECNAAYWLVNIVPSDDMGLFVGVRLDDADNNGRAFQLGWSPSADTQFDLPESFPRSLCFDGSSCDRYGDGDCRRNGPRFGRSDLPSGQRRASRMPPRWPSIQPVSSQQKQLAAPITVNTVNTFNKTKS